MAFSLPPLEPLQYDNRKCNNYYFDQPKCDFCIKACPYQALSFDKALPSLNEALCKNCGLCQQVCPRGAFSFPLNENTFSDNTYVFICQKLASKGKVKLKACHCLYNLNLNDLFFRLVQKQNIYLVFNENECLNCHQFSQAHFEAWINNLFLPFVGAKPTLNFITYEKFFSLKLKANKENTNKRRFFVKKLLKTSLSLSLDYTLEKTNLASLREGSDEKNESLPIKWLGLKQLALSYPLKNTAHPLPFYSLQVSSCDFCGHCVRNCPQNALEIKRDANKSLIFIPTRCDNCNLCLYSCEKAFISYSTPLEAECLTKEIRFFLYKSNEL